MLPGGGQRIASVSLCVLTASYADGFHFVFQHTQMMWSLQCREAKCLYVSCQLTTYPTATQCLNWSQEFR